MASDGGHVVALDFPLCHFELRVIATSSADSIGLDADRLEFRFKSAADRLDVKCSTLAVPSTWLVVSRVSGPTLIKNSHWCRDHYARIEGPEQTMQLSQLASIHAHWTASVAAKSLNETGPRIGAIDVSSHPENLHLTCESPLFRIEKKIVPKEAMALQYHDPETERATMIVPPIGDASTVQVAAKATEYAFADSSWSYIWSSSFGCFQGGGVTDNTGGGSSSEKGRELCSVGSQKVSGIETG